MTEDHFMRAFEELRDARPFQIFTVELHGGRRFEIDHANALIIRDGVAVFLAPGGGPIVFDHDSVLSVIVGGSGAAV